MRIVCRTGKVDREMDSPIKVGNSVGYTNSTVYFSYKVSTSKHFNYSKKELL